MDAKKQVQVLQLAYAGALADTVLQFSRQGVLARVVEHKREEALANGRARTTQFGVTTLDGVFSTLAEIFGCAPWTISEGGADGFVAVSKSCRLCAIAKKIGAPSPCRPYCLDPMEGMIKALKQDASYQVEETLWDGGQCRIKVR
jgi:hypothetical protein